MSNVPIVSVERRVPRGLSFSAGKFPAMRAVPWGDRLVSFADVTQSGKAL